MRGLERKDSPILAGYQIYHNYVRPHMALKGKTPAEVAGIEIKGKNKWLTIIQNASQAPQIWPIGVTDLTRRWLFGTVGLLRLLLRILLLRFSSC